MTGRLDYSEWEAQDGGGRRSKHEVIAQAVDFLGGAGAGGVHRGRLGPGPRGAATTSLAPVRVPAWPLQPRTGGPRDPRRDPLESCRLTRSARRSTRGADAAAPSS